MLRILAAILLLGNVQFVEGEGLELDVKGNNGKEECCSKNPNAFCFYKTEEIEGVVEFIIHCFIY